MFDVKKLPKTPGTARRLLAFSQLNGMIFDEGIVDLAGQELISTKDLVHTPYPLTGSSVHALQHVMDWNGRAMLLESGHDRSREVALASVWQRGGPTLIMAQPKFYAQWAHLIRQGWPDAKISIFGNPRYTEKGLEYPDGVEFTEKPDWDAEFFITSYGGLIWNDFCSNKQVNQTIVEELDNMSAINYRWSDAVQGMFHELPSPLFIQNIHNLPSDSGRDNLASIQISTSKAINFLSGIVCDYLWAGIQSARPLMANSSTQMEEYLSARGYQRMNLLNVLSLFGVSSHLLDEQGNTQALTFMDETLVKLKGVKNYKSSGLYRMVEREQDIKTQTGQSIARVVRAALDGDQPSLTLVGGLMTNQWANLKANHLKVIHTNIANKMTKSVIIAENSDLRRNLRLHFGVQIEELSTDPSTNLARFLHTGQQVYYAGGLRPLANIVVTLEELASAPELLSTANFLFLPQIPLNAELYQDIRELANIQGTRVVHSILQSSFEEELHKQL